MHFGAHVVGLAFGSQALWLLLPVTALHSINCLIDVLQRRLQGPAATGSQEAGHTACSGKWSAPEALLSQRCYVAT